MIKGDLFLWVGFTFLIFILGFLSMSLRLHFGFQQRRPASTEVAEDAKESTSTRSVLSNPRYKELELDTMVQKPHYLVHIHIHITVV